MGEVVITDRKMAVEALQPVFRFRRFVRMLDAAASPPDLASAAAEAGYADQAHLTRECSGLSGLTPAGLARARHAPAEAPSALPSAR
jgi:hypothetical protein